MYCEPEISNIVSPSYGWRGFGGLMFDKNNRLFTQYNLEACWKRRLAPFAGIDRGLLSGSSEETSYLYRLPGHYQFEVESEDVTNKNLICVNTASDEPYQLSIVKEHSERRYVDSYELHSTGDDYLHTSFSCNESSRSTLTFPEQISEIRRPTSSGKWKFFVRSRQKFYGVAKDDQLTEIFLSRVNIWEQSHLIADEITLYSEKNMLWTGKIGQLARVKPIGEKPLRAITYSDHPKVIFVADSINIRTLDTRAEASATSDLIFFSTTNLEELKFETPSWTHIKSLPNHSHIIMAVSTYGVFLIDERMPGYPILQNEHCIPHGAHLIDIGDPLKDINGDGWLQCSYLLDKFCTGIWKLELYNHKSEDWSSVRPLHGIGDPNDVDYVIRKSQKKRQNFKYPPTRGMAVLSQNCRFNRPLEILFRYLDDGSVMYKTFHYGLEEKEDNIVEAECLENFDLWSQKRATETNDELVELFGKDLVQRKTAACLGVEVKEIDAPKKYSTPEDPLMREVKPCTPLELLEPHHSNAFYSNIVNSYFGSS